MVQLIGVHPGGGAAPPAQLRSARSNRICREVDHVSAVMWVIGAWVETHKNGHAVLRLL
jgi:hypothetical protein